MNAINKYNSLFYTKVTDPFESGDVANFFTVIEPVQVALAKTIESLVNNKTIRVKELGVGTGIVRWGIIPAQTTKKWEVVLTDFDKNVLPDISRLSRFENFTFSTKVQNLIKPFTDLGDDKKYDVLLTTYGFDSIWFPQDCHYEKINGNWWKANYSLEVDPNILKKKRLAIADFKDIIISKKLTEVSIDKEKFGKEIKKYYQHKKSVKINFPGGLIKKITESFDFQIADKGLFISGDMAVGTKAGKTGVDSPNGKRFAMRDFETSGKVAKFKIEDYGLAKIILEKRGFRVTLATVEDFVKRAGYEIPLSVKDHLIMKVQKS